MHTNLTQYLEEYSSIKQRNTDHGEVSSDDKKSEDGVALPNLGKTEKLHNVKPDQNIHNSLLRKLIRHKELKAYCLESNDLAVISGIYQQTRENYDLDFSVRDILGFLPSPPANLKAGFDYLISLVDRGILSFSYPPDQDFHTNLASVLQGQYRLNGLLWNILLGNNPLQSCAAILNKGFKASAEPLEVVCDALSHLFNHYPELKQEPRVAEGVYYGKVVNQILGIALDKISCVPSSNALSRFITAHNLDSFWQKCLFMIYFHQTRLNVELSILALATLITENKSDLQQAVKSVARKNLLQHEGLLEYPEPSIYRNDLSLSDAALTELTDTSTGKVFNLATTISDSAYFSMIKPRQTMDQLILPAHTLESIKAIVARLTNPRKDELVQWGLMGASLTDDVSVQQGCIILLHGEPGTGKTFIAGVIANELNRSLLMINANNIRDMYNGSTEKRARAMFQEMRQIAAEVNPVFLLNEGDQLIHKRGNDLERSADVTENAIQSIFLEEMESFPGILIVTSNLAQNLDPAMSRRFHYKLEIPAPDAACRLKLWQIHLHESIPGTPELDLESLAQEFPFTGGQISLVVLNACHEAFTRGHQAKLCMNDLYKYARLELGSSFESKSRAVGFR